MNEPLTAEAAASLDTMRPKLISIATRQVGCDLAEDAVQTTMLRVIERYSSTIRNLEAFACVVLANVCLASYRDQSRERVYHHNYTIQHDAADVINEASTHGFLLNNLHPNLAQAMILRLEGLTFAQAATESGISPGAAKWRYTRAVQTLRRDPIPLGYMSAEAMFADCARAIVYRKP